MRGARDVGALFRLRRLIRERGVSLVHTIAPSTAGWAGSRQNRAAARSSAAARVDSNPAHPRLSLADRIITSGEAVRATVIAAGIAPDKIVVVSAGVDTEQFHPASRQGRARRAPARRPPVVGLVANVEARRATMSSSTPPRGARGRAPTHASSSSATASALTR